MNGNQEPSRASFSHLSASALPGEPVRSDVPSRAAFAKSSAQEKAERRESFMVSRDRPTPVQRPSPSLAHGTDAAAFNNAWEQERAQAERYKKRSATTQDDANREAKKAKFIEERKAALKTRFQSRSR